MLYFELDLQKCGRWSYESKEDSLISVTLADTLVVLDLEYKSFNGEFLRLVSTIQCEHELLKTCFQLKNLAELELYRIFLK